MIFVVGFALFMLGLGSFINIREGNMDTAFALMALMVVVTGICWVFGLFTE